VSLVKISFFCFHKFIGKLGVIIRFSKLGLLAAISRLVAIFNRNKYIKDKDSRMVLVALK
jgi:hypothetical protein